MVVKYDFKISYFDRATLTYSGADDCRVGEPECRKRVTRVDPDAVENRRCVKCERSRNLRRSDVITSVGSVELALGLVPMTAK